MRNIARRLGLTALLLSLSALPARAEWIYGLTTTNGLVSFNAQNPGVVSGVLAITGIGSESILDIDLRPSDGGLYGLGSAGNLYSINTTTGVATFSASLTGVALDPQATRFGIDFNPVVDRLRIVSNTGQDLRLTPGTGATNVDGTLNGAATGAVSVAYTNSDTDPTTGTTLFYIGGGSSPDTLFNTSAPNLGTLTLVGALGVTSTQDVGFDISVSSGIAYASLTDPAGGGSSLYMINLTTGAGTLVGGIGSGLVLRGITVVPEPASLAMVGIGLVGVLSYARGRRGR